MHVRMGAQLTPVPHVRQRRASPHGYFIILLCLLLYLEILAALYWFFHLFTLNYCKATFSMCS